MADATGASSVLGPRIATDDGPAPRGGGDGALTGSVARNSLLNLIGQMAPLLVAPLAIRMLTRDIGPERFGLLTMGWVVLGYFSLFDFGIGRAMTRELAARRGGDPEELASVAWTSLTFMLVMGAVGSFVAWAVAPLLVDRVLRVDAALRDEALMTFVLLAAGIVLVVLTTGLRGVLEAYERFDLSNAMRIPMGLFTFLGPVAVLPFRRDVPALVVVLLAGRVAALIAHWWCARRLLPGLRRRPRLRAGLVVPLLRYGGWMTVSNIVSPLMVYIDRFVIGAVASLAMVAFYTAPYEAITKLMMIPGALSAALFPAFAAHQGAREELASLYRRGTIGLLALVFPASAVAVAVAPLILGLWLGHEYERNSTAVFQWLAIGIVANAVAHVPAAMLQARGRPDLTAKLHLIELPLYLVLLPLAIARFGITGAAIAWCVRAVADAALLGLLGSSEIREGGARLASLVGVTIALLVGLVVLPASWGWAPRIAAGAVAALAGVALAWQFGFTALDRELALRVAARLPAHLGARR